MSRRVKVGAAIVLMAALSACTPVETQPSPMPNQTSQEAPVAPVG